MARRKLCDHRLENDYTRLFVNDDDASWLNELPSPARGNHLESGAFCLVVRLICGFDVIPCDRPSISCHKSDLTRFVDDAIRRHLTMCKRLGFIRQLHDMCTREEHAALARAGIEARFETRYASAEHQPRGDLKLSTYPFEPGIRAMTDTVCSSILYITAQRGSIASPTIPKQQSKKLDMVVSTCV